MEPVIWGLVGSLIGALLVWFVSWGVRQLQQINGQFAGKWEQLIYNESDRTMLVKRDIIKCRQIGEGVEGTIRREFPADQNHFKWNFRGRCRGKFFFGYFWSAIPEMSSYGTLQLRELGATHFVGFYVRMRGIVEDKNGLPIKFSEELKQIPFEWKKLKNRN